MYDRNFHWENLKIQLGQFAAFLDHRAYQNSWTLDARVERWTLDAELWMLDSGRFSDYTKNHVKTPSSRI